MNALTYIIRGYRAYRVTCTNGCYTAECNGFVAIHEDCEAAITTVETLCAQTRRCFDAVPF